MTRKNKVKKFRIEKVEATEKKEENERQYTERGEGWKSGTNWGWNNEDEKNKNKPKVVISRMTVVHSIIYF